MQRVVEASVTVDGTTIARIGRGLLVLAGVSTGDTEQHARSLADKVVNARVFPDADKPMNRSVRDVGGEVLLVSQFTLAADTRRGNRPGFSTAAAPGPARVLFELFVEAVRERVPQVQTGEFGADMEVALVNDGPVTLVLDRT